MAWAYPFTTDEGAYLYDAYLVGQSVLPHGDVLVKAPLVITAFASGVIVTHGSLYAARLVNLLATLAMIGPFILLMRTLGGERSLPWVLTLWLVTAGIVLFGVLGHTEPLALLWATSALALWACLVTQASPVSQKKIYLLAIGAGACAAAAFMSRKTMIAISVPALLIWVMYRSRLVPQKAIGIGVSIGIGLLVLPWILWSGQLYGIPGIEQALGVGYFKLVQQNFRTGEAIFDWGEEERWALLTRARVLSSLNATALIGLCVVLAGALQSTTWKGAARVLWGVCGLVALGFGGLLMQEPYSLIERSLGAGWIITAGYFFLNAARRNTGLWCTAHEERIGFITLSWLVTSLVLYAVWPATHTRYLADIFPPLALLGALGIRAVWQRRSWESTSIILVIIALNALNFASAFAHPWTGTFTRTAILSAAEDIAERIPREESILTSAFLIPYVSGHRVYGDITHPFWYRYPFVDEETKHKFLPPFETIEQAVIDGKISWILRDVLTDYAYVNHSERVSRETEKVWHVVTTTPNNTGFRNNPLTLWQRSP